MGRVSALALLILAFVPALAPARAAQPAPTLMPGLRSMDALTAPDGQLDAGVGLYPALASPASLAFPSAASIAAAGEFAAARGGRVAFAVADGRGRVSGRFAGERFESASLTKAMILVAFLRRRAAERRAPSQSERTSLGYMIRLSDNGSADIIYSKLGDGALRELARSAGMSDFAIAGDWANATLTAADQARFFLRLDALLPRAERNFGRGLLEGVMKAHAWGIPRVSRPRWRTFFKGGWRPGGSGELVHQAALLERGSRHLAVVVMTDGNPLQRYGELTIEGVARLLLGGPAQRRLELMPAPAPPLTEIDRLVASVPWQPPARS